MHHRLQILHTAAQHDRQRLSANRSQRAQRQPGLDANARRHQSDHEHRHGVSQRMHRTNRRVQAQQCQNQLSTSQQSRGEQQRANTTSDKAKQHHKHSKQREPELLSKDEQENEQQQQ